MFVLGDRDFGDLAERIVLIGKDTGWDGSWETHTGGGHGDDAGYSAASSEPGDAESAPSHIGDDDESGYESDGLARIAGDQSSDHPPNLPSGLVAVEEIATDVIQIVNLSQFRLRSSFLHSYIYQNT